MQIHLTELSELSLYQPVKGLNSYNTDAFISCCDWYVMYDKVSLCLFSHYCWYVWLLLDEHLHVW